MHHVNYRSIGEGVLGINFTLGSLDKPAVSGDEEFVNRVSNLNLSSADYKLLSRAVKAIGVTDRFRDVISTFSVPAAETPPGFRIESTLLADGLLSVDLVRDIGYDKNGVKRPTQIIYSADSANPYEIEPIARLLGNLTCNPGIVYDLFINNPKANVGQRFTTMEEVMTEIGNILGPGCDISIEIEDPFAEDFDQILGEIETYRKILSDYRLVVKVPHTGPVNNQNVKELLTGDQKFSSRYNEPTTVDALRGHNLALKLRDHGFRVNYTLMFDPYQTNLALQAKPYYINSFIRHRKAQSEMIKQLLEFYQLTHDPKYLADLRTYMIKSDYLASGDTDYDLFKVLKLGEDLLRYRHFDSAEGSDGLDSVRHNLRLLRQCNLPDTRLIICSMEGPYNYPEIDKLTAEPEFADMLDRIIITAEPGYLAQFTSSNQVVSYQRRFMNAAASAIKT